MTPDDLITKASRAALSAELLLNAGDLDGASNRAYYSMFDAARAALKWSGAPVVPTLAKTHYGLIYTFSLQLVKNGLLPVELGKSLNRAAEIWLVAGYSGYDVPPNQVKWIIKEANVFIATVKQQLESQS